MLVELYHDHVSSFSIPATEEPLAIIYFPLSFGFLLKGSLSLLMMQIVLNLRGSLLIRNRADHFYLPKLKRNNLEIYNDILSAIGRELIEGDAKRTRVQSLCNLAYDKLVRYLDELESKKIISPRSAKDNRERTRFFARL